MKLNIYFPWLSSLWRCWWLTRQNPIIVPRHNARFWRNRWFTITIVFFKLYSSTVFLIVLSTIACVLGKRALKEAAKGDWRSWGSPERKSDCDIWFGWPQGKYPVTMVLLFNWSFYLLNCSWTWKSLLRNITNNDCTKKKRKQKKKTITQAHLNFHCLARLPNSRLSRDSFSLFL